MATNFEDAKSHNGCRVVRIKDHETAKIYGSAEVIIAQDVYKNMLTYLNHYRPKSDADNFFLSWSGLPIDGSLLCHALSTELSCVGIEKKYVLLFLLHNSEDM